MTDVYDELEQGNGDSGPSFHLFVDDGDPWYADTLMLRAALYYGERNIPVFPHRHVDVTGATTDAELISKWWTEWPDADVYTPTGNQLGVFDVLERTLPGEGHVYDEIEAEVSSISFSDGAIYLVDSIRKGRRNETYWGPEYYYYPATGQQSENLESKRLRFHAVGSCIPLPPSNGSYKLEQIDSFDTGQPFNWKRKKQFLNLTDGVEFDSWDEVDLFDDDDEQLEPSVGITRDDGIRMLYPRRDNIVIGKRESGKSWFALACVKAEIEHGNQVLYVHFEDPSHDETVSRLEALGLSRDDIRKYFHFVSPKRAMDKDALRKLTSVMPSLVIFDGLNAALALHGWLKGGIEGAAGYDSFRKLLIVPFMNRGAATLTAHHMSDDEAYGSQHIGNVLMGAEIILESVEPYGRNRIGHSRLSVGKDRAGYLRQHGKPTSTPNKYYMGKMTLDATGQPSELSLSAPPEETPVGNSGLDGKDDAHIQKVVKKLIVAGKVANKTNVREKSDIGSPRTDAAVNRLVGSGGLIESSGPRNARHFTLPQDQPEWVVPRDV